MPFIRQLTSSDTSMIGQYLNARMAASSEKQYQPCNSDEPAPSETSSESAEHNCYTCELYKASARASWRWAVFGWVMTFVLAVGMTVVVWVGDAAFARRCFDSTMAYCEFHEPKGILGAILTLEHSSDGERSKT